jgi:amino acid transporter
MNARLESPRRALTRFLIGDPLQTTEIPHQTIGKRVGLAVFASDALSSTAYATEEILLVLVLAGAGALSLSLPIAGVITILMAVVTISYQQTIYTYPGGGGAYTVARDNLGETPAQVAGAGLLIGYILTVSVSISSAVAQMTSAFPELFPHRTEIAVALVVFMTIVNLRGIRESGKAFSIPSYIFLVMMFVTIVVGFYRYFTGTLEVVTGVEMAEHGVVALTPFLVLRAFSSGCSALTGIEAISNGITAFKPPSTRNAAITLIWMSGILATMFLSITFLARQVSAVPSHTETVISQIGRTLYGTGSLLSLALLGSTMLILTMAANTSFAGFPRLSAIQAADQFLPKQLTFRGSRLVYSYGIVTLAVLSSLLIMLFRAQTTALIPLYAIGVFLSFTLSQCGMAVRWWKVGKLLPGERIVQQGSTLVYDPAWRIKLVINGFGAISTAIVTIVFGVTKFRDGAWIVVFLIPTLVFLFYRIHDHYKHVAGRLSLEEFGAPPGIRRHRVLVPIGGVHRGVVIALHYARSLSDDVTALYVSLDPVETEAIKRKWQRWGDGVRLKVVESPYRVLTEKIIECVDELQAEQRPHEVLTIVVPQLIARHWWDNLLHARTAHVLRRALLGRKDIIVTDVPYQLRD